MAQRKILIVEDEDNIAVALEYFIGRLNYAISRVADGDAAVEALKAHPPDLVVLDVMLPKRTGYEICQIIREDEMLKGIKILMMTAKGGKVERAKGLALGADAFMTKPFAGAELVAQIEDLLGGVSTE